MPFCNKIGRFENVKCGLVHMFNNLLVPVPLKNVKLDVKVVDFVGQVTITQEYVNRESNPIEVKYSYPVEESAAIIGKKHALKKYDQFTLNTSCFWRSVPVLQFHEIFVTKVMNELIYYIIVEAKIS